ncbi:MAG: hypothetical protein DME57_11750 [Verrucomicrobia bacterium]|nr:MAG: hypothetical protein DME57_11750 [Verrucomicrobiota bacterium]
MNKQVFIAAVVTSVATLAAFGQMPGGYGGGMANTQPPPAPSGGTEKTTTTTTKTTYPKGVKEYLDQQVAGSKDKKFHVSLNGKDVALTPVKIHEGGKSTTPVDMKSADGKIYEIDFTTTNGRVTGARIGKVNGKTPQ